MPSNFFLASESEKLNPTSKIAFPDYVTFSGNEPSKSFSLNIHQVDIAAPTHKTFCLLCRVQIYLLVHIRPQKTQNGPNYHFHLGLLPQMTRHTLTMKTLTKCLNQVKKLWRWKDTSLPINYFIKYSSGGFEKIWIMTFIYIILHIFYHSIFSCIALRWWGNITSQ